jgi:hypothetical protein
VLLAHAALLAESNQYPLCKVGMKIISLVVGVGLGLATVAPSTAAPTTQQPTPNVVELLSTAQAQLLALTPQATPQPVTPTAVPTATSPTAVSGQLCPAHVHGAFLAFAPNGLPYPTWHPPVDPVSGCLFGHEHGDDPSTSAASTEPITFGYVADIAGVFEPHEGYKVFLVHNGTPGDQGPAVADYRIVIHTGTARTGRYRARFHSMDTYDYVARDGSGRYFHLKGMADTKPGAANGSVCDLPRHGGKDFSSLGCNDPYEIWNDVTFAINHPNQQFQGIGFSRVHASTQPAVFDPITTRDPADETALIYSQDYHGDPRFSYRLVNGVWVYGPQQHSPLSPTAFYQGCRREIYGGPNYWTNASQPTEYFTDAYGNVQLVPGLNWIRQEVAAVNNLANDVVKVTNFHCGNGIRTPN